MLKQYTREELLAREKKRERVFTVILRLSCCVISMVILAGCFYFFTVGGMDEWRDNQDLREFGPKLALAIMGLFTLTTTYAIRGDKSVGSIRRMFSE